MPMCQPTRDVLEAVVSRAVTAMELVAEAQFIHGSPIRDLADHAIRYLDASFLIEMGLISDFPPSLRDSWVTGVDDQPYNSGAGLQGQN
jgi:hypothetical protein